ncbi:MAG: DNA-processing protein DprA [Dehalococcoidales bacterium]|nr:DNA-processing protein DprA [Dehalococcoidales bacterium]
MESKHIKYYVGFSLVPRIGRVKFSMLENYFKSMEDAWLAAPGELKRCGLDSSSVHSIVSTRDKISLDEEMDKLNKLNIQVYSINNKGYPARLKEIYDYPPVIYVKGSILPEDEFSLSVVGTRKATIYGKQVTEELVTDLARNNITIISGLARGIDTIAHKSALVAGGRTIAVFACGLDTVYPPENTDMVKRIIDNGAIISEYPPGIKPRPDFFPRRNRIMSGLSLGVLVVEAGETSGAIITANNALEQNREVFAIPGSILSPASKGTNHLIQEGAKLVSSYRDILEELNLTSVAQQIEMIGLLPESDTESHLFQQLGAEPLHIDEVCRLSGLPISTVSSTLAMMELKGLVKQVGAMNYSRARETREEYRVKID